MDKTIPVEAAMPRIEGTFLGQPKGVAYLAMTEAWERFSFYGMRGLLILYMVQDLLLSPERVERIAGMSAYRSWLEGVFGPMSTQAFASQTFGLYAGFVYFTPLFGGLIADRWLGAKKTVMFGILMMTAGHFAMVFDWSFLIALLLLVLGSGCLKGNIAAQVGHLYAPDEEARRTRGFTIFSTGINIGATLGPLVCGFVAQVWGWHFGFGTAGVMMLFAAVVYFAGWNHFADDSPARRRAAVAAAPPMGRAEWGTMGLVLIILILSLFQFLAYDQTSNAGMLWVAERVDLVTPVMEVPEAWFLSEDSLASILIVPFLIGLWGWQGRHGEEPHDTSKMATGAVVMGLSVLALALGDWVAGDGKASLVFPAIAFFLSGVAFMFSWPTMLALVSRRAPAGINAMMMAAVYLTGFVTGVGSGWVAQYYETMPPWQFWSIHAALCFAGAVLLWVLGPVLRRRMDRLEGEMAVSSAPAG
jgi:proton-dependent oligopeptide transporter, POT family